GSVSFLSGEMEYIATFPRNRHSIRQRFCECTEQHVKYPEEQWCASTDGSRKARIDDRSLRSHYGNRTNKTDVGQNIHPDNTLDRAEDRGFCHAQRQIARTTCVPSRGGK